MDGAEIQIGAEKISVGINQKTFGTGSRGYSGMTRATIAGKKYMININIVEIGSKPKTESKPP